MSALSHTFKLLPEADEVPVARHLSDQPTSAILDQLGLAHFIEQGIRDGRYAHYTNAANLLGVTRVRISQIVSLLSLAPAIQEAIPNSGGQDPLRQIPRRKWRALAREPSWDRQLEILASWGVELPNAALQSS